MTSLIQQDDKTLLGASAIRLTRSPDHEGGEALLNQEALPISRKDFQFLYALAQLQQRHGAQLFSAERLLEEVKALFPRYEAPASIRTTGPEHQDAFESILEQVLDKMEMQLNTASGKRWRNLLLSQARRYATGLDNAQRFELMSELRQHRDLLELMIRHFEQSGQHPPLKSPAARLYRFFVPEQAAGESRRRIHGHVAAHLGVVREALKAALPAADGEAFEPIWGAPDNSDWEAATIEGFMLSEKLSFEL